MNIPIDDEGFITFECPYCSNQFKLNSEEFQDSNIIDLYCPFCGLINQIGDFYTKEVVEKAEEIAMNYAIDELNKMFKGIERNTRSSKFFKIKAKPIKKEFGKELYENIDTLEITKLICCNRNIKISLLDIYIGFYCPYCGGGI